MALQTELEVRCYHKPSHGEDVYVLYGFVYVGQTRMGFSNDQGLWFARHWPNPSKQQVAACFARLDESFPEYDWKAITDAANSVKVN